MSCIYLLAGRDVLLLLLAGGLDLVEAGGVLGRLGAGLTVVGVVLLAGGVVELCLCVGRASVFGVTCVFLLVGCALAGKLC